MPKSIIEKTTLEVLEKNAPEKYDVKENLFNIDIYKVEDKSELFQLLYVGKKGEDAEHLNRIISGMLEVKTDDLVFEDGNPVSVSENLINKHKKAAMVILDGERVLVHYK